MREMRFLCSAAAVVLVWASCAAAESRRPRPDEDGLGIYEEEDLYSDRWSEDQLQKCRQVMDDHLYAQDRKKHDQYQRYYRPKKYDSEFGGEGRRNKRSAVYREDNVEFYRDPYRKTEYEKPRASQRRYDPLPVEVESQYVNDLYNADGKFKVQSSNRYEVYEAPEDEEESESEVVETRESFPVPEDEPDSPFNSYVEPERDQQQSASGQANSYGVKKDGYLSQAQYHASRGKKADKGYKSAQHHDERAKGSDLNEHHQKQYSEQGGKKMHDNDGAGHYGQHEEAAQGSKAGKFDEKKGHKKGHKTKGYHNRYHKDEYHKEHKFYDDYHKSGSHHRYGNFKAKHNSNEQGHKKYHHLDADNHADSHGKKGFHSKGHVNDNHKGHNNKNGQENSHAYYSNHAKKGGNSGGKHYGFQGKQ